MFISSVNLDVDELREQFVEMRAESQHSMVDNAIDQWWKRLEGRVNADDSQRFVVPVMLLV